MGIQQTLLNYGSSVVPGSLTFLSPGTIQTWVVPKTAARAFFRVMAIGGGGGGGGGNNRSTSAAGSGGGSGAKLFATGRFGAEGQMATFTIGAGGAGGGAGDAIYRAATYGSRGGNSSMLLGSTTVIQAGGGGPGLPSVGDGPYIEGSGGGLAQWGQYLKPGFTGSLNQVHRMYQVAGGTAGVEFMDNDGTPPATSDTTTVDLFRGGDSTEDYIWSTYSTGFREGTTTGWNGYGVQGTYGVFGGAGGVGWQLNGSVNSDLLSQVTSPGAIGGANSYWAHRWYAREPEVGVGYGGGGGGGGVQNEYEDIGPGLGINGATGAGGAIYIEWGPAPFTL